MFFSLRFPTRRRSPLASLAVFLFLITVLSLACSKQEEATPAEEPATAPEPAAQEVAEPEDPLKEARNDAEGKAHGLIMPITEQAQGITSEIEAAALAAPQKSRPARIQQEPETGQFANAREAQNVMARHQGAMKNCYERSLRRDPSLRGRVNLTLVVDTSGKVTRAKASGETLHDSAINNCMEIHARTIVFPKPEGGAVRLNFPYNFSPQF